MKDTSLRTHRWQALLTNYKIEVIPDISIFYLYFIHIHHHFRIWGGSCPCYPSLQPLFPGAFEHLAPKLCLLVAWYL